MFIFISSLLFFILFSLIFWFFMLGFYKKYKFFNVIIEKIRKINIDISFFVITSILILGISVFISSIIYENIFK